MDKEFLATRKKDVWNNFKVECMTDRNPTVDHEIGLKTLHTYIRRQTLVSISTEGAGIEGVQKKFSIGRMQAKFNLDMLENAL